jgi:competence protein ComEA
LARVIVRTAVVVALAGLAVFLLRHPASPPALVSSTAAAGSTATAHPRAYRRAARAEPMGELVVYVAGDVRTPGLYRLHDGDRAARAVALAGGMRASADAGAVNLAARPSDGEEIYVPATGEAPRGVRANRGTRRARATPRPGSVDVNRADAGELAAVPGIGRAVAARIVELRRREGNFASLDELLDVAGMTQTRLERARPYLREP